jgi:hypothetical protein
MMTRSMHQDDIIRSRVVVGIPQDLQSRISRSMDCLINVTLPSIHPDKTLAKAISEEFLVKVVA